MEANKTEVVVITGASAGVGRATAREFGRHGASVALLARGEDGLEGAKREIEAAGGEALAIPTDVADPEAVEEAARRTEERFGPIDVWINDAITTIFSPFREITAAEYRRATEVTYLGTVVQVGSALAFRGIPLQAPYCGAKHAIRGFTNSVRTELEHDGSDVHITMVELPAVNTPQFDHCKTRLPNQPQPVPPIYQPEVPARAIYWAAHHRRRDLYLGGSSVGVIIGNKLLPGLGDRYLARTGYDSQQTDKPVNPNRPHNLFEPVPGDHGAHGRFDESSSDTSYQWWATSHRGALLAALGLAGAAFVALRK